MTFGEVVSYRNRECVYLAATDAVMYLAVVPDAKTSAAFITLSEKADINFASTPGNDKRKSQTTYCFIVLKTEQFKNRIAHYGNGAMDYSVDDFFDSINMLDIDDKKKLKDEILKDGAVSGELQDLVREIAL